MSSYRRTSAMLRRTKVVSVTVALLVVSACAEDTQATGDAIPTFPDSFSAYLSTVSPTPDPQQFVEFATHYDNTNRREMMQISSSPSVRGSMGDSYWWVFDATAKVIYQQGDMVDADSSGVDHPCCYMNSTGSPLDRPWPSKGWIPAPKATAVTGSCYNISVQCYNGTLYASTVNPGLANVYMCWNPAVTTDSMPVCFFANGLGLGALAGDAVPSSELGQQYLFSSVRGTMPGPSHFAVDPSCKSTQCKDTPLHYMEKMLGL